MQEHITKLQLYILKKQLQQTRKTEKSALKRPSLHSLSVRTVLGDFYDKRADRFVGDNLNNLVTYKDGPEHEDAWNIDDGYKMRPVDMNWQNEITLVDINDERVTVRVTKKHNNTVLTQDIIAYANITRVDVVSHVDWQENIKFFRHLSL